MSENKIQKEINTETSAHIHDLTYGAPQVWVGCMNCYNNGKLRGKWIDAERAADVVPEDIHIENETADPYHGEDSELWCFDVENMPKSAGEMSPQDATVWGEYYNSVGDDQWEAFCTWCNEVYPDSTDVNVNEFRDSYVGEFESFSDYLQDSLNIDMMMNDWPELAQRYFDYDAFERDAKMDFNIIEIAYNKVLIFDA